ncbi:hypothetical protein EVAR_47317_1 [Eumeta japonica]|uniref:Uncharacterized protein n=1 Tax=Eumeta variegata TaxID=151549 RepID=A0A4C1YJP7_EUMVA|nr:hypothetical protein EVAR_47317_1 [Eumeta japonica]
MPSLGRRSSSPCAGGVRAAGSVLSFNYHLASSRVTIAKFISRIFVVGLRDRLRRRDGRPPVAQPVAGVAQPRRRVASPTIGELIRCTNSAIGTADERNHVSSCENGVVEHRMPLVNVQRAWKRPKYLHEKKNTERSKGPKLPTAGSYRYESPAMPHGRLIVRVFAAVQYQIFIRFRNLLYAQIGYFFASVVA